jgi:hypothetical protein
VDTTKIIDDEGGLTKTVSVENSFRRGTVCSVPLVHQAMADLYVRLPKLLQERQQQSTQPQNAFPTTIRLTARSFVGPANDQQEQSDNDKPLTSKWESNQPKQAGRRRRSHVTKSKQAPIDGRWLLSNQLEEQQLFLKRAVAPLLQELIFGSRNSLNITRLNIAMTGFADQKSQLAAVPSSSFTLQNRVATGNFVQKGPAGPVASGNKRNETISALKPVKAKERSTARQLLQTPLSNFATSGSVSVSVPRPSMSVKTGNNLRRNRNGGLCDSWRPSMNSNGVQRIVAEDAPPTCNSPSKRRRIDQFFPRSSNRHSN